MKYFNPTNIPDMYVESFPATQHAHEKHPAW